MLFNYIAIVAAAVASMIIGGLWYGPLFGKAYIKAMGWEHKSAAEKQQMQKDMMWSYLWQFIASIVTFSILEGFMAFTGLITVYGGLVVAFFAWLGFIVPMKFGDMLWGGKKYLFWLSISCSLLTYLAAGAILGAWH